MAKSAPRLDRLIRRANGLFKLRLGALLAAPGGALVLFVHAPALRAVGVVGICLGVPALLFGAWQVVRARG